MNRKHCLLEALAEAAEAQRAINAVREMATSASALLQKCQDSASDDWAIEAYKQSKRAAAAAAKVKVLLFDSLPMLAREKEGL